MANARTYASTAGGRTPRTDSSAAGGGGGQGFLFPVDTIARVTTGTRLVDVDATTFPDGTLVFVRSVRDFFVLDKDSALTSDNITIADAIGGGRWTRRFEPDVEWLSQASWTIDPTAADDEGDGSPGDPLQTHAELGRRAFNQGWAINQDTVVNITQNGLPAEDPVEIDVATPTDVVIRYVGDAVTLQSGTLTDATALSSGTALPTVEDTVNGFGAPDTLSRIRLTSGASSGAIAWMLRDDGANVFTTSAFATTAKTPPVVTGTPVLTDPTPGGGDDYVLEGLPRVRLARVKITHAVGANLTLLFDTLEVGESEGAIIVTSLDRTFFIDSVILNAVFQKADANFSNVLVRGINQLNGQAVFRAGALAVSSVFVGAEAAINMQEEHTAVGESLISGGIADYSITGPVSAHDAPAAGLLLEPLTRARTVDLVWGSGNGTYGINAAGGQLFYAPGTQPTVTGSTNDTRVGGVDTPYAGIPAFNGGDGSAIVETPT